MDAAKRLKGEVVAMTVPTERRAGLLSKIFRRAA
jgi:septum site-determining protein MinD